jgi:YHS domain-containing protein
LPSFFLNLNLCFSFFLYLSFCLYLYLRSSFYLYLPVRLYLNLSLRGFLMATCPVCNVDVEEKRARGTSVVNDQTYYFDSKACKKKFDEDQEKFMKK